MSGTKCESRPTGIFERRDLRFLARPARGCVADARHSDSVIKAEVGRTLKRAASNDSDGDGLSLSLSLARARARKAHKLSVMRVATSYAFLLSATSWFRSSPTLWSPATNIRAAIVMRQTTAAIPIVVANKTARIGLSSLVTDARPA